MSDPLLTKDAINLGGHKLPLPVVGAVVGVLGLVLFLRARSRGASIASVGSAPAAAIPDLGSVGVLGNDSSAQLMNISQQLGSIQSQLTPQSAGSQGALSSPLQILAGRTYFTATGSEQDAALAVQQAYGGALSDIEGRLEFFNPAGAVNGKYFYPVNVPGYQPGDLPRWQQLIVR